MLTKEEMKQGLKELEEYLAQVDAGLVPAITQEDRTVIEELIANTKELLA